MKRRSFLETAGGTAALAGLTVTPAAFAAPAVRVSGVNSGKIGTITVTAVRDQFRSEFNEFVAFFDKNVVDTQYGGFMCGVGHDGARFSENKSASTEGRGIWCFSFMYNNGLVKDKKYLDYAKRSVDFIMKDKPGGTNYWPSSWSREGKILQAEGGLPGDCYIGEGLAEYARATGDQKLAGLAKDTMLKCLAHYDRPDFKDGTTPFPGARNLWYWMLFMWFGTNWLMKSPDPELEKIVDRCMEAIMTSHMNPEFQLLNLDINHDNTLASGANEKSSKIGGCGHATEATWMIMYEAARRRDRKLFDRASDIFRRHVEVSMDDVYGGVFNDCEDVNENKWELTKIFWAQAFVLIGALQVIEHTGADWARDMYAEQFDYIQKKCRLNRFGFQLMMDSIDRKAAVLPKASRKDIYHHPRYLMLNLLALERIVKKGGKVSGVLG